MSLRATLFDMDGLLIDSEILWHKAELEIFPSLGVPLDDGADRQTKGMYVEEVVAFWFAKYPWSGPSTSDVTQMLLNRVGELVENEGVLLPGAIRAIELASEHGPVAVASSTPTALIHRCLDNFSLREKFVSIHSAQDEEFGKPHPGVFISAAKSLGVSPKECLVFEDSAAGVLAAKAGSMSVIAVPTKEDREFPAFKLADVVLSSLEELSPAWLSTHFA